MKQLYLIIMLSCSLAVAFGQHTGKVERHSVMTSDMQQLKFEAAKAHLARISAMKVTDSVQRARKALAEDTLFREIAALNDYSNSAKMFDLITDPIFDDHPVLNDYLGRMILLYKKIGFKYGEFRNRKELADLHLRQRKMKLAEAEVIQLIKEVGKTDLPTLPQYYDLLSGIYLNESDFTKALATAYETLKHVRCAADSVFLPNFYLRIASVYHMTSNPKVLDMLYKMADYYIKDGRPRSFYPYLPDFATLLAKWHKAGQGLLFLSDFKKRYPPATNPDKDKVYLASVALYNALEKTQMADNYFLKHIELTNLMISKGELKPIDRNSAAIGEYYYKKKQYAAARIYFSERLQYPSLGYPHGNQSYVYRRLSQIDSLQGNYISAMHYLSRYVAIKDSIFTVAKNKQIEELQISYETAQKEKALIALENNQKLQQVKLVQAEHTRNWILGGSLMLVALLGMSYRGYLLKQKNGKILLGKNQLLQRLINEKEWLLKEVHHRVKNNLHTVICLLESQAVYLENDALKAIENSQHRIYAMSLIHQKLYQSEDIKTINMAVYLPEFIHYLNECFEAGKKIRFHLEIDPVELGVSQAIPLALIINEAVTNAIKYAFAPGTVGIISVSMKQEADRITLCIADNGKGIDPGAALLSANSLGMKLMNGLSQDINAELIIQNDRGTKISVVFNLDPLNKEPGLETKFMPETAFPLN